MNLKKPTITAAILFSLTACGSGGNNTDTTPNKPNIQNEQSQKKVADARKAEEARKAKEAAAQKAEEARKAKEEAEQKAEEARKAKETAEQKAEEARKAKEAADKAEADRKAKEAAEKAEADRKAKEAADKAEADRKAKEAAEKLEQEINQLKGISADAYPEGKIMRHDTDHVTTPTEEETQKHFQRHMVYNQKYSVILADYEIEQSYNNNTGSLENLDFSNPKIEIKGLKTEPAKIPQEGTATYSGKAFDGIFQQPAQEPFTPPTQVDEHLGNLSYTVNFTNKTGSGTITGFGPNVELKEGKISGSRISADAQHGREPGKYSLDFFGKDAEEIGGKVTLGDVDSFGFGGTRGEIQK